MWQERPRNHRLITWTSPQLKTGEKQLVQILKHDLANTENNKGPSKIHRRIKRVHKLIDNNYNQTSHKKERTYIFTRIKKKIIYIFNSWLHITNWMWWQLFLKMFSTEGGLLIICTLAFHICINVFRQEEM